MNLGNTLFTTKDASTGELRGVSVIRELASRLGVPLDLAIHATPGQVADAVDGFDNRNFANDQLPFGTRSLPECPSAAQLLSDKS